MSRRLFDFFYIELCTAVNERVPRYGLWLEMGARGCPPERLVRESLLAFYDEHLVGFLAGRGIELTPRRARRLRRRLARFEPRHPTPYEFMERISTL